MPELLSTPSNEYFISDIIIFNSNMYICFFLSVYISLLNDLILSSIISIFSCKLVCLKWLKFLTNNSYDWVMSEAVSVDCALLTTNHIFPLIFINHNFVFIHSLYIKVESEFIVYKSGVNKIIAFSLFFFQVYKHCQSFMVRMRSWSFRFFIELNWAMSQLL